MGLASAHGGFEGAGDPDHRNGSHDFGYPGAPNGPIINTLLIWKELLNGLVSTGQCNSGVHELGEGLCWRLPVECTSGSAIE